MEAVRIYRVPNITGIPLIALFVAFFAVFTTPIYAETGGKKVERNDLSSEHFTNWIDWAKSKKIGLDLIQPVSLIRKQIAALPYLTEMKVLENSGSNTVLPVVRLPKRWVKKLVYPQLLMSGFLTAIKIFRLIAKLPGKYSENH